MARWENGAGRVWVRAAEGVRESARVRERPRGPLIVLYLHILHQHVLPHNICASPVYASAQPGFKTLKWSCFGFQAVPKEIYLRPKVCECPQTDPSLKIRWPLAKAWKIQGLVFRIGVCIVLDSSPFLPVSLDEGKAT